MCQFFSCIEIFLTYLQVLKPQTIQGGGRNKFAPLDCPYAPFSIPAWSAALQAVDRSSPRLIEPSKTYAKYGHYTFPNPGLFTHPATAAKYIESWLRIRDIWFMRLEQEPSLAMSSQAWRTLLSMDTNTSEKSGTKAALRRQESLNMLLLTDMYPEVKLRVNSIGPIVWQDQEYLPGVLPPENVVRQILWELYEVNFIYELLSLDRRACADLDSSNTSQLFERQIEISQCFSIGSIKHTLIPLENDGLAADDLDKRFRFIMALFLVMQSWKGVKPIIFNSPVKNLRRFTPTEVLRMEKVVAEYYCQQFYDYFRRAAQIPHRLFATID